MDPAGTNPQSWCSSVERTLSQHESFLKHIATSIQCLSQQFAQFSVSSRNNDSESQPSSSPVASSRPDHEPRIPPPEHYGGEYGSCKAFLTQCEVQFQSHHPPFPQKRPRWFKFWLCSLVGCTYGPPLGGLIRLLVALLLRALGRN